MVQTERDALTARMRPSKGNDIGAHKLAAPDFIRDKNVLTVGIDHARLVLRPGLMKV